MSREQDLDRNQQATPYKLEEARKRGQLARSPDAATLAVLAAAMLMAYAALLPALRGMASLMARGLAVVPSLAGDPAVAAGFIGSHLREALVVMAPLLGSMAYTTTFPADIEIAYANLPSGRMAISNACESLPSEVSSAGPLSADNAPDVVLMA